MSNIFCCSYYIRLCINVGKKGVVSIQYSLFIRPIFGCCQFRFNEPRNVAVYLIRHLRNDTLKHVGEQFGIDKYSTFSSIAERVKYEMKADKGLKNRIQIVAEKITKSQWQTRFLLFPSCSLRGIGNETG